MLPQSPRTSRKLWSAMAGSTRKPAAPPTMKRKVLDLQILGHQSVLDWMDGPPTTHIKIDGVTLTLERVEEYVRAGSASAKADYLDRLRRDA